MSNYSKKLNLILKTKRASMNYNFIKAHIYINASPKTHDTIYIMHIIKNINHLFTNFIYIFHLNKKTIFKIFRLCQQSITLFYFYISIITITNLFYRISPNFLLSKR